jgi:hypothetical protein
LADIEIAGHKVSVWWLVGGGAGLVLVVYLYRRGTSSSTASTATGTSGSSIDPVTGLPYSEDDTVDPVTGMTYLAEAQEYGSVQAAEEAYQSGAEAEDDYGSDSGDSGYVGTAGYPTSNVGTTSTTTTAYTTNAQWAQAVTAGLVSLGYSASDVTTALGLFFADAQLSSAQANIIQIAEAEYGVPPVGTYSIVQSGNGTGATGTSGSAGNGSSTGTGTSSSTATVPDCSGLSAGAAHNSITAAGLHAVAPLGQEATQQCIGTSPPAGTVLATGSNVEILTATGTTTGTGSGSTTVAVPNCKGMTAGQAHNAITSAGLHATAGAGQKATSICTGTSPAAGAQVTPGSNVEILT